MDYLKVFIVKFIMIGTLTFSLFGIFFNATIPMILLITLVVSGVTYLGDLFILPRINHAVAVIGDFILFFTLYTALGSLVVDANVSLLLPAFAGAYFGVMAEALFHIYVTERLNDEEKKEVRTLAYQTEFSEEITEPEDEK